MRVFPAGMLLQPERAEDFVHQFLGTARHGVEFALNRGDEASHGYRVERMAQSLERYFNFGKATGCRGIHGGQNPFCVAAQNRPLLIAEHHKRDCPSCQILLIAQVFVGRQQNIEARGLRRRDQFAIRRPFPSTFKGFDNDVAGEGVPKRSRCAVVKQDEHRPWRHRAEQRERRGCAPRTRSRRRPGLAINGTTP